MKIVVTADGTGLDAPASRVFGRCQTYVFVETESMDVESVENPAIDSPSGAGIEAAQFVVEQGAETVVTGNVGPNAFSVLEASGVPVYLLKGGTVGEVVEAFKEDQLAEGGGDFSPRFSPCCEWDTAAGQAVLEAAGGAILGMDGRPLRYNCRDSLLSPNFYAIADRGHPLWQQLLHRRKS